MRIHYTASFASLSGISKPLLYLDILTVILFTMIKRSCFFRKEFRLVFITTRNI